MSWEKHEDDCPGCRPAIVDMSTGLPLPPEHPMMVEVMKVWALTTPAEREAFHQFTCCNSRDPAVLRVIQEINARFQLAWSKLQ